MSEAAVCRATSGKRLRSRAMFLPAFASWNPLPLSSLSPASVLIPHRDERVQSLVLQKPWGRAAHVYVFGDVPAASDPGFDLGLCPCGARKVDKIHLHGTIPLRYEKYNEKIPRTMKEV